MMVKVKTTKAISLPSLLSDNVEILVSKLIQSCCKGNLDVVKWIVEHKAINANSIKWYTPLTAAVG